MLVDSVEITLRAGRGGNGVVSWRREKFVPKGGPDGGDGGRGGSIIFKASHNLDTLSSFRYRKVFQAANGENGASKKMTGRSADNLELEVPVGTSITDAQTGMILVDLLSDNQNYIIAKGGKGGLGNPHFVSSTHQFPTEFTPGEPGQVREVKLELTLLADLALIGLPNAGKSSIINALTGAESRIGAYAFSTTEPVLGVMRKGDTIATIVDLPGLIEGAHKGKGLGHKFLKHTTRVKAFLQVIDAADADAAQSEKVITQEIEAFEPKLVELPRQIVINKIDLLKDSEIKSLKKKYKDAVFVSASNRTNLTELEDRIVELVS